jgi:uncharacterized protein
MILCDTGALIAMVDRSDKHHNAVKVFESEDLLVPTTVLCEVDYFLTKYLGENAAKSFLEAVSTNNELLVFDETDLTRVNQIRREYDDLPLGFVDASLIALAERYRIRQILTIDRKHFSAVKPLHLGYLELLP